MGLLRVFLAASVVVAHVGPIPLFHGISPHSSVMIFFIVSGFYMTMLLNEKYVGPGAKAEFYFNRFFRLWPLFALVMMASAIAPILIKDYPDNPNNWIWPAIWTGRMPVSAAVGIAVSNVFMIFHDWQFFFNSDNFNFAIRLSSEATSHNTLFVYDYVPQAWSIGVEIGFYACAPFIVRSLRAMLIVASASLFLNVFFIDSHAAFNPWLYAFLPAVFYLFMLGGIAYHLYSRNFWQQVSVVDLALLVLLACAVAAATHAVDGYRPTYLAYTSVAFALIALAIPALFHVTKTWRADRLLGELSYPLYLVHLLIYWSLQSLAGVTRQNGSLTMAVSLALSAILLFAIDLPMDAWRHRAGARVAQFSKEFSWHGRKPVLRGVG